MTRHNFLTAVAAGSILESEAEKADDARVAERMKTAKAWLEGDWDATSASPEPEGQK